MKESRALAGARGARDAAEVLNAGFTSVRELGGDGHDIDKAITEGYILGPKIYSSISIISPTAGHADVHTMPLDAVHDACSHGFFFEVADGVPECLKAVRLQLRKGAKVIKICTSGGNTSEIDDPLHQQFSDEELKAMVDEARRADRVVAAHCHGKAGIMAALRAGCKTIEHGSYLDDETIAALKSYDAILVPTRSILQGGLSMASNWTERSFAKVKITAAAHLESYRKAVSAGVRIASGSDLGPSREGTIISHGREGMELKYAVEVGMTPLQAIEASTASGPDTLGPQAPLSGQLKDGYDADFLALSQSPLDDIEVFTEPKNITHIWKAGRLVKSPEAAQRWTFPGLTLRSL